MAEGAPNPPLYAALLSSIHLILFATLVRLYSARSNRDYAFLAVLAVASMLVSAILTVETGFLIALGDFSGALGFHVRRAGNPAQRDRAPFRRLTRRARRTARRLNRALGLTSLGVAVGRAGRRGSAFLFHSAISRTGYLSSLSLQPGLLTGFSDNVTLGQIGEIKKNPAVVMRIRIDGDPGRAADMHWRGIVLTNFTGTTWNTPPQDEIVLQPNVAGEYYFGVPPQSTDRFNSLHYTVLMEPIATDAIFVAPPVETLRGKFGLDGVPPTSVLQRPRVRRWQTGGRAAAILFIDRTGSLFNPSHNNSKIRYEGTARLPIIAPADLRKASPEYPDEIRDSYLQLPPTLDPR